MKAKIKMNVALCCYQRVDINIFYAGGTAGAFSRITGSLGQAVATLTFDSNFQMVSSSAHVLHLLRAEREASRQFYWR